ncbi:MAG TPA: HD domain-containing phosphohydrolase [Thermoleophilaceae bacterium]|nr:HD domain-containing phosphohydrolase [Thermoleophilaceae bacterium]
MDVSPRLKAPLQAFGALTCAALLAYAANVAFGFASGLDNFFDEYVYTGLIIAAGVVCLARGFAIADERGAWLTMGAGLMAWAAGEVTWAVFYAHDPAPPVPSVADVMYLAFYPASYASLLLLARSRTDSFRTSLWLDGGIAALTVAALVATLAFQPIVDATGGSTAEIAVNLAYPAGDLLLLTLVVTLFGLNGWRPDPVWLLIGGGMALTAVADGLYFVQISTDQYQPGGLLDLAWPASALLVSLAAWQPARKKIVIRDWLIIAVPVGGALVAVQLLVYDHFQPVNLAGVSLASWALLLALARLTLAFLENQRTLSEAHGEARTDSLTGLRNRRSLMADLDMQIGLATAAHPRALLLFDLDGFKEYNDAFGHPAGDGLLVRLAARLAEAVNGTGDAYRLGGDEFCVLAAPGRDGIEATLADCCAALNERGEGFEVTSSFGVVTLPDEADNPTFALQLADRRMYARKGGRRMSAGRQSRDVLLRTLSERRPDLQIRLRDIGELALAVGRELHLGPEALDEVARAAELHDVGKIAVPDAILDKPGPLDPVEWSFMRRHPLIGERILLAAPALRPVARLVRSSHERWDGGGYPDGLRGDEIPLGARVVAVCDAFDAMTTERPYREPITEADAIAELRRCAGTQFDPMVVDAFCRVIAREHPAPGEMVA